MILTVYLVVAVLTMLGVAVFWEFGFPFEDDVVYKGFMAFLAGIIWPLALPVIFLGLISRNSR